LKQKVALALAHERSAASDSEDKEDDDDDKDAKQDVLHFLGP